MADERTCLAKDSVIVDDLAQRFASLPSGAWDSPPNRAVLLSMTSQAQSNPAGIIVIGLNPYRPLDVSYAGFLKLIAGQVAASISNARAYENRRSVPRRWRNSTAQRPYFSAT